MNIGRGNIFGFIGPNGAGKTTTIKCIAGLIDFQEGIITVNNRNIMENKYNTKQDIGYIPDTPFLYDKLTGDEFLYFVSQIYKMEKNKAKKMIDKYADILDFKNYSSLKTEEYSHGMKQRIVIASAFIHEPFLVLIDEPMVGLDPKSAKAVKYIFEEFVDNGGTLFVSTHTLSLAEEICTQIGIMDRGNIVYSGNINNLRQKLNKKNLEDLFIEITENKNVV